MEEKGRKGNRQLAAVGGIGVEVQLTPTRQNGGEKWETDVARPKASTCHRIPWPTSNLCMTAEGKAVRREKDRVRGIDTLS